MPNLSTQRVSLSAKSPGFRRHQTGRSEPPVYKSAVGLAENALMARFARDARILAIISACVCSSPSAWPASENGSSASSAETNVSQTHDASKENKIALGYGASLELPAPPGAQVWVGDGKILKATDLGNAIRIVGKHVGSALFKIGGKRYFVRVLPLEISEVFGRIETALEEMKGLYADAQAQTVFVRGRLLRAEDWDALASAVGSPSPASDGKASAPYRFAAEIEPSAQAPALERIRARLAAFNLPLPALRLEPMALASLSAEQFELEPRYVAALAPYGFTVEKNPSLLSLAPMIRVHILIAEMRRSFQTQIGAQWPDTAQAQILPNWQPPGTSDSPIGIDIHALEKSGMGKVLASPHILCRSGKEAEFFAGGEFPTKVSNFHMHDVVWKKYGVTLKIKPTADAQGRMSIGLQTEISNLDTSINIGGIPGIVANRIESHFDLSRSRTIALSGLIKKEWNDGAEGLPLLSRLPILGKLFSSQDWLEKKSELVVFVTPETMPEENEKQ